MAPLCVRVARGSLLQPVHSTEFILSGAPRSHFVRRLHPLQVRALPLRRVSKVGFSLSDPACWPTELDHRAGSFLCALTQGADPQLKESANWSLQADPTLSVLRNFIEKRRASHCEIRLKLSASSPVPSPSSQAPHPLPPKAVMLCACSCPRCTKLASPLVSQVKWGVGFTPAGAARPAEPAFRPCPTQAEAKSVARRCATLRRPACYAGGPPLLPFTPTRVSSAANLFRPAARSRTPSDFRPLISDP